MPQPADGPARLVRAVQRGREPDHGVRRCIAFLKSKRPMTDGSSVVVVDNYDSFTGLIAYYLSSLTGEDPLVFFNKEMDVSFVTRLRPKALIISPGPGHPAIVSDVGECMSIIK